MIIEKELNFNGEIQSFKYDKDVDILTWKSEEIEIEIFHTSSFILDSGIHLKKNDIIKLLEESDKNHTSNNHISNNIECKFKEDGIYKISDGVNKSYVFKSGSKYSLLGIVGELDINHESLDKEKINVKLIDGL